MYLHKNGRVAISGSVWESPNNIRFWISFRCACSFLLSFIRANNGRMRFVLDINSEGFTEDNYQKKPDKINIRVKNRAIPSYSADSGLLVVRFYWDNL